MLQLTFKQTDSEIIVRAAATVLFNSLTRCGVRSVNVSELAEQPQYGFTASAATEPVGPKLVRITDLQDGQIDWNSVPYCECAEPSRYLLRDNDLLFARTGATTGKTHLVKNPERAVFASYLIRLRPRKGVLASYLHSFFQSDNYWAQISEEKEGSAQPNVNGEKLSALEVPFVEPALQQAISEFLRCVRSRQDGRRTHLPDLPPPLDKQRRVVERIEELATQIHEARMLRQQAAEEADALVASETNSLFVGDAMHRWPTKSLGEVAEIRSGVTLGRTLTGPVVRLPYLRVANVQDGHLDLNEMKEIEILESEAGKWKLQYGDLLLTEGGDWDKLGRGTVWREEIPNCIHQNHIFRVRTRPDEFVPEFVAKLISSPVGKAYFQEASKQTTNLASINQRQLKAFQVFQPPISEQRRIVAELDSLQTKVHALQRLQVETAAELDALLPAILHRAFKGEL